MAEWVQKQDSMIFCQKETSFSFMGTHRWRMSRWKKTLQANDDQKKADVVILIIEKVDFNSEKFKRDNEDYYIVIKGSIHQEDITLVNTYALNFEPFKYIKQVVRELIGEINSNISTFKKISKQRI